MAGIPSQCPERGNAKTWKKEINIIRFVSIRGLFAEQIKKALGYYKVTYRCHSCGFHQKYNTESS